MRQTIVSSVLLLVVFTIISGLIYPLTITGIAQLAFPVQANGSLVYAEGAPVGSKLIGQQFTLPKYFHPRPSVAGNGYDASVSAGSNFGPTNQKHIDTVQQRSNDVRIENALAPDVKVPSDLVLASSSGLDPHITIEAARIQGNRIAAARNMDSAAVQQLIEQHTERGLLGLFGIKYVNVLELNIALDKAEEGRGK